MTIPTIPTGGTSITGRYGMEEGLFQSTGSSFSVHLGVWLPGPSSKKTNESFTDDPRDWNLFSYIMEKHQRNYGANGKIMNYMQQTYGIREISQM